MSDKREERPCLFLSLITHHLSLSEEDFGDVVDFVVEAFDSADRVVERDAYDLVAAQRDHVAPAPFEHYLEGLDAEARGEHAVEGRRRAAALHVSEVRVARVYASLPLYLAREVKAYAAQTAVGVNLPL